MRSYLFAAKFLFSLIILFFILPTSVYANWQKYNGNPVLQGSSYLENNLNPFVNHENNTYKIWYTAGPSWKIRFGTSENGITNWIKNSSPVLQASGTWEKDTNFVNIIHQSNTYKLWYQTNGLNWVSGADRFRLGYATSNNELSWSKYPNYVLYGTPYSWDSGGTDRGFSIIYKDNIYHLWYAATNSDHLGWYPFWRIGYATSPDGISWTKQNNGSPVIVPTESWELRNVSYPNVLYENGKYKMWYAASNADMAQQIVYAESTDGINWSKPANQNPVLTPGSSGFDRQNVSSPFVLHEGNTYKMWYSGFDGSRWRIGYATEIVEDETEIDLNVPLIKQTTNPWESDTYNTANIWSPLNPTINRWGCAMVSANMLLRYYGYNKLPDGTNLDPRTLNQWLINQKDGYIGKGYINWIAISRLSKLSKNINNITGFNALEFERIGKEDKDLLTSDIKNSHPQIIEEPGHFIAAKGIKGNTFLINDPFYSYSDLNSYSNSFRSIRRFIPSSTNLSYILVTTEQNLQISLKDNQGNPVGEEFMEEPLIDPVSKEQKQIPLKLVSFKKPQSGDYIIKVSSNTTQTYFLKIYLYDKNGEVTIFEASGIAGPENENIIQIDFDSENTINSKAAKIITFESIIKDIEEGQKLELVNNALARNLISIIEHAKIMYEKDKKENSILILKPFETLINVRQEKGIEESLYQILFYDITYLKNNL